MHSFTFTMLGLKKSWEKGGYSPLLKLVMNVVIYILFTKSLGSWFIKVKDCTKLSKRKVYVGLQT